MGARPIVLLFPLEMKKAPKGSFHRGDDRSDSPDAQATPLIFANNNKKFGQLKPQSAILPHKIFPMLRSVSPNKRPGYGGHSTHRPIPTRMQRKGSSVPLYSSALSPVQRRQSGRAIAAKPCPGNSEVVKKPSRAARVQGARSAGTGVYTEYMRIPSTAQRRNRAAQ